MSLIATLRVIPESSAAAIRAAVEPQKASWFRKPRDVFWSTLDQIAPDVLHLEWSGYTMLVLLEFLRAQRGIDLEAIHHHPLAEFLSNRRGSNLAVFEPPVASVFVAKLETASLSDAELTEFANAFDERNDAGAGKALLGAARALRAALAQVSAHSLGLLHVG